MPLYRNLNRRTLEPEEIDDPKLATHLLHGALHGLTTINYLSASARAVWPSMVRLARRLKTDRLRVLDVATGAGDIPLALWRKSQYTDLQLEIHGVDLSERALEFARRSAHASQAKIQFSRLNVVTDEFPANYDVVMSSLFLHHLDDETARRLLTKMAAATNQLVLVNDLRRHPFGLALAHFAGRVLTRSPVVRVDAVRSVRAAFTIAEVRRLAAQAGLGGAMVSTQWPCRYLLSWQR